MPICLYDGCVADEEKKKLLKSCFKEKGIKLQSQIKGKWKTEVSEEVNKIEEPSLPALTGDSCYFFWLRKHNGDRFLHEDVNLIRNILDEKSEQI